MTFLIDRKLVQQIYVRTCQDSGYNMSMERAARFTAGVLQCSPFDVWGAFNDLDLMAKISTGEIKIDIVTMKKVS